jgi:hypothetical protein
MKYVTKVDTENMVVIAVGHSVYPTNSNGALPKKLTTRLVVLAIALIASQF